ncbi:hypothetical protein D3C79_641430 [compost metagenome]
MQGAEQHQPIDECLGALAHPGIFRQLIECKQTDVVDRVVGGRVPLDKAVPIDGIEPLCQALCRDGALLFAAAARGQETFGGEQLAGQVLGGVEAEGVVLAPEPHHVIAWFIHPVAIAEDGTAYPSPQDGREVFTLVALPDPEQRDQGKVGTILAGADPRQGVEQQLLSLGGDLAAVQHGQQASCALHTMLGAVPQCLLLAIAQAGRWLGIAEGLHEVDTEAAVDGNACTAHVQYNLVVRRADVGGEIQGQQLAARRDGAEIHLARSEIVIAHAMDLAFQANGVRRCGHAEPDPDLIVPGGEFGAHGAGKLAELIEHVGIDIRQRDPKRLVAAVDEPQSKHRIPLKQLFQMDKQGVLARLQGQHQLTTLQLVTGEGGELGDGQPITPESDSAAGRQLERVVTRFRRMQLDFQPPLHMEWHSLEGGEGDGIALTSETHLGARQGFTRFDGAFGHLLAKDAPTKGILLRSHAVLEVVVHGHIHGLTGKKLGETLRAGGGYAKTGERHIRLKHPISKLHTTLLEAIETHRDLLILSNQTNPFLCC